MTDGARCPPSTDSVRCVRTYVPGCVAFSTQPVIVTDGSFCAAIAAAVNIVAPHSPTMKLFIDTSRPWAVHYRRQTDHVARRSVEVGMDGLCDIIVGPLPSD